jgi:hypothetical protein
MPDKLNTDIYGSDPQGEAGKIDTRLSVPDPVLDINGETDSRAQSEGNHGRQG